ncbi:DUF4157 domain-containing protein [Fulvimonas sp. R45]|uniref:eCIS core domain-containing protein n=1 Tax=Fulvimonas sp. R45 TaxID=3045937 RepID=UPI00265DA999|nr:DUF4157 domain-containing protein [Fulvimonas sp. R45]MDO1529998.1 DUF4157 domain-containing protein [Fulvimonas sp. R45]
MKTSDTDANTAQRQPAAASGEHEAIGAGHGRAVLRRGAFQEGIDQSPRMLAQRHALQAMLGPASLGQTMSRPAMSGSAFQRQANEPPVQVRAADKVESAGSSTPTIASAEALPATINATGMPHQLKAGIEALSGMDLSDVRVHRNSGKPAQLSALAYAQGNEIHLGPGQERHLPHEAWHVVQQRQGRVRPTMQMAGVGVNDDARLEREADTMGAKALQRVATSQPATSGPGPSWASQTTIQKVDVGYVPAVPGAFRTTTTIALLTGTPASDKPFSNTQRPLIYANNIANGGGAPPVIPAGNNPRDDVTNGGLLDRQIVTQVEPEIDHIVPRAEGGANDYSNARVLSKQNNVNAMPRPNNAQKAFRLYEAINLSANIPQNGQPNFVYPQTQIPAGAALGLVETQLLAIHAGLAQPPQITSLGQAGANAIKNDGRGTANFVTIA